MRALERTLRCAMLAALLAGPAAGEESLVATAPPTPDPRLEAEIRAYQDDLARLRRQRNYVIAVNVALWAGCAGTLALAQVEVAAVVCTLAGGSIVPFKFIRQDRMNAERELRRLQAQQCRARAGAGAACEGATP